MSQSARRAHPEGPGATILGTRRRPGQTVLRARGTIGNRPASRGARLPSTLPPTRPIFMGLEAGNRHEDCPSALLSFPCMHVLFACPFSPLIAKDGWMGTEH